jgi:membrane protein implicated in regulation of membrane protease activity
MIILGLILLLIGYLTGLSLLYYLGGILLIVGVVFLVLGNVGRPVGGRKVWF